MNDLTTLQERPQDLSDFDRVRISIASPERIRSWSYGEIKKPETINYRTFKPENDGLFCARIFGPTKDFECLCGKYKRMKYKGVVCEKCGVEVTRSRVRRERMGHVSLAVPVAHIWFLKSAPTHIGMVTDMPLKDLESILYFERFIVTDPGISDYKERTLLSEAEYETAKERYGDEGFTAMIGAEALKHILSRIDIQAEIQSCRAGLAKSQSEMNKKKIIKRLRVLEGFNKSKTRPEWMILEVLPVIPPDLRPLAQLDGGRFATSDLNNLYRRLITRNNRLRRFIELRAPDIIIRNEKRMLQEAVDALYDNGRRGNAIVGNNKRPLKSLSDMLKGKQGRFRKNLLGKRVDFSGRSVIVVGPELKLHQCGLPKKMALELFKPFVWARLERKGLASTYAIAKKQVEKERPEIWDILEEVIREHPVLLNRAPTLHRLGIQAFEPVLIEGKAIQLHPLVCAAFNADFDGDQMAVHVPLSLEAQLEARVLMMSTNNILSPASGKPIIVPSQDIILGLYYLTHELHDRLGAPVVVDSTDMLELALQHEDIVLRDANDSHAEIAEDDVAKLFEDLKAGKLTAHRLPLIATQSELNHALESGAVTLQSPIKAVFETVDAGGAVIRERVRTTVGRMILSEILPRHHRVNFALINRVMTKREIGDLINSVYLHCGQKETVVFSDKLMEMGFAWACKAGISFGKDDLIIPDAKHDLVIEAQEKVKELERQYMNGLITQGEKYNKVVDIWGGCGDNVTDAMMKAIISDTSKGVNAVYMMAHSGARGSEAQIKQLAGMRGLMAKPSGEIIETPIISNFKEGLSVLEYFNSTHGARKGLADTALKTASSGYLTRRLVDVAQDVTVTEQDCGTNKFLTLRTVMDGVDVVVPISERILGRTAAENVAVPGGSELIIKAGDLIDEEAARRIDELGINLLSVRSPLMCASENGICATCYGRDLARGTAVNIGEAVGIIAAESIGEPGTQLTMRTFHIGGAAHRGKSLVDASIDGRVHLINYSAASKADEKILKHHIVVNSKEEQVVMSHNLHVILKDVRGIERARYYLPYGAKLFVKDDDSVKKGDMLAEWYPEIPIISECDGKARYTDLEEGKTLRTVIDETTGLSYKKVVEWHKPADDKDAFFILPFGKKRSSLAELKEGSVRRYVMDEVTGLSYEAQINWKKQEKSSSLVEDTRIVLYTGAGRQWSRSAGSVKVREGKTICMAVDREDETYCRFELSLKKQTGKASYGIEFDWNMADGKPSLENPKFAVADLGLDLNLGKDENSRVVSDEEAGLSYDMILNWEKQTGSVKASGYADIVKKSEASFILYDKSGKKILGDSRVAVMKEGKNVYIAIDKASDVFYQLTISLKTQVEKALYDMRIDWSKTNGKLDLAKPKFSLPDLDLPLALTRGTGKHVFEDAATGISYEVSLAWRKQKNTGRSVVSENGDIVLRNDSTKAEALRNSGVMIIEEGKTVYTAKDESSGTPYKLTVALKKKSDKVAYALKLDSAVADAKTPFGGLKMTVDALGLSLGLREGENQHTVKDSKTGQVYDLRVNWLQQDVGGEASTAKVAKIVWWDKAGKDALKDGMGKIAGGKTVYIAKNDVSGESYKLELVLKKKVEKKMYEVKFDWNLVDREARLETPRLSNDTLDLNMDLKRGKGEIFVKDGATRDIYKLEAIAKTAPYKYEMELSWGEQEYGRGKKPRTENPHFILSDGIGRRLFLDGDVSDGEVLKLKEGKVGRVVKDDIMGYSYKLDVHWKRADKRPRISLIGDKAITREIFLSAKDGAARRYISDKTGNRFYEIVVGLRPSKDESFISDLSYRIQLHWRAGDKQTRIEKPHLSLHDGAGRQLTLDGSKDVVLEKRHHKFSVTDKVRGTSYKMTLEIDWRDLDLKPRIELCDKDGDLLSLDDGFRVRYDMLAGALLSLEDNVSVKAGDLLARIPLESGKTSDITGGLPRVAELFEARRPKDTAVIADRDGIVRFGPDYRGKRQVIIESADDPMASSVFMVQKSKHILAQTGDFIRRGDELVNGDKDPHDILEIQGTEELASYLVEEIQSVYRLQGVKTSDKHIEVIMRQMLQKVEILSSGDSLMLIGDQLSKREVEEMNARLAKEGEEEATHKPILQGITRASLQTGSFISAASFQETTRILTEASVGGKIDYLEGLKENVIVGRLVPAGTGGVIKRIRSIAAARDEVILEERRLAAEAAEAAEALVQQEGMSAANDDGVDDSGSEPKDIPA